VESVLIGVLFGSLAGLGAWRLGALTPSGALSAAVVGTLVYGLGGWQWALVLLTFFISSSTLSRTFTRRKSALQEKFSKGHRRDWAQVFANGGLGALLALAVPLFLDPSLVWAAFAGSFAAVNADTWATELGVLNPSAPRLITNGRKVERGTSGAVSPTGLLASAAGAGLVALVASLLLPDSYGFRLFLAVFLGGLAGSLFDSLLGATVQASFWCSSCHKETERYPIHLCGTATYHVRGWRWLNNDWVNFACSAAGAAVAAGLWLLLV
jgi:uncharacterized protein (TIGR00297 family)